MRRGVLLSAGVIALGLLAAVGWRAFHANGFGDSVPPHGVLGCPGEIDLGSAESYQTVEAVLPLSNTGGGPLTVSGIKTDCACLGVYLLPDRRVVRAAESITIPPGEVVGLALPLRVTGVHGVRAKRLIRFRTDDPDRPEVEARLIYLPLARYFSDPAAIALGEVATDHLPSDVTADLFTSDARVRPTVHKVVSTHPKVRVSFDPDPVDGDGSPADGTPGSRRFGRVRVTLHQLSTGESLISTGESLSADVQVFIEGRAEPAVLIPVSVRAITPVELVPSVVYLPRSSSEGPLYSALVECRVTGNPSLELRPGKVPIGVTVRVEDAPGNPASKRVRVECDPARIHREVAIGLTAILGDKTHLLTLRVITEPVR